MALARYQAFAQDANGNVIVAPNVDVRRESDSGLATLYSDRNGSVPLGNPFVGDGDGLIAFHVTGGAYKITVTKDSFSRVFRYVGVGTGSEADTLAAGSGVRYLYDTSTSMADPGAGNLRFNSATLSAITALALSSNSGEIGNPSVSAFLNAWDDSTTTPTPAYLIIKKFGGPENFVIFKLTTLTDNTTWKQIAVTHVTSSGSFLPQDMVSVEFSRTGDIGVHAGIKWLFDTSTSMADPGSGDLRLNNATPSSATAIAISSNSAEVGNPSVSAFLNTWDDSTNPTNKGYVIVKKVFAPEVFAVYLITALADNTTWKQLTVSYQSGSGTFSSTEPLTVSFFTVGDQGLPGTDPGMRWLFDSSTSMADPGSGDLRLNNATLSSVTAIAISDNTAETGNPSADAFIATWDDSTNTALRGFLLIKKSSAPQNFAIYSVTAALTDNTTWWQVTVAHVSSSGSFSNTDALSVQFYRTGNIGTGDLLASNNLSELTNFATARTNLGVAYGKQSIWVPASAMVPRTTNGAASGTLEMATNKNMVKTLDFDTATQEFAQFDVRMPKSWNESTVTFIPVWSHPSTTTNFGVVWGLDAVAISDDDTLDVAFGTAQTSTDTGGTTNDSYQGPESSAITVSGTPAAGDLVQYRIHRDPANGSDTMAVDARLHGILLLYTNDTTNDT